MNTQFSRRRAWLMAGGATGLALAFAVAGSAQAQTASAASDDTKVEEVVVTGIRRGIEGAISLKKSSTAIVEAVSAEDIGKLPDVSIAESIARLPGLTAQRLDGRGQVISIRGLAPDFTTALLNGREQVSTGDNRGVEFDQYPSELLSAVVVYKTPDAALIGQGLAGTADMQTVRPLAYGKRALAVGARYEWNDIGALNAGTSSKGNRFSISYIDQFADGKVGLALGYAHMESPYQAERWNAWGYPTADSAGNLVVGGAKPYVMSSKLKRDGVIGVLEFKPNEHYSGAIDVFYSKFDNRQILRGIELPLYWSSATLQPGYSSTDKLVTKGTFSGVKGVVRNDGNTRDNTVKAFGWNNKFFIDDNTTVTADLSWSKVKRTDQILESYSGTGRSGVGATDTLGFTMDSDGVAQFNSTLNYADASLIKLTSPQGWGTDAATLPGGQDGYLNKPTIEDELKAIRLSAKRMLNGPIKALDFGVNYSERSKQLINDEWFLRVKGNPASVAIPSNALVGTTSLAFMGIKGMVSYDPFALIGSGVYDLVRNPNADVLVKSWNVEEKVTLGYLKADIDTDLGGVNMTGNVGVQVVHTDQSSVALGATGSGTGVKSAQLSGGKTYTDVLPSANLQFHLGNEQVIRVSAARTMARPRMDQMRASKTYSYDPAKAGSTNVNFSPWGGSGGNPELEPWRANAFDVSYEKYFGRQAYVSLAGFYKDLKTYVYDQNLVFDFKGFPVTSGPEPALRQGIVSTPQNGKGGSIKGVEFTLSMPGALLTPALDGFGAVFSASHTDSKIRPNPSDPSTPIPGLSKNVANLTVYYEKDGFSARISNRYRSKFLGEVSGFGNGRNYRMVKGESVVDAQVGYTFNDGPMEGLSLLAQVNNLTDEPFTTYQNGDTRQVIDYQRYGRTFLLGASYKF
ncbi:TonB-dependent receptor [Caulobacter sp. FWC26]|uniref:TonB-dependent receptor n=1 Tax=Caulobacter sp. FWC26 TaxID=69665 RepID=UPI000C161ED1|nr:TonB-dependent receptor [Caulobacter sp. FWC26]AZS22078.1 TonB-dependent receptor [Caulobacter sp. FWC26]